MITAEDVRHHTPADVAYDWAQEHCPLDQLTGRAFRAAGGAS
jgi:hypothetical protein